MNTQIRGTLACVFLSTILAACGSSRSGETISPIPEAPSPSSSEAIGTLVQASRVANGTPSGPEVEEIVCEDFELAYYNSLYEYSHYGLSREEWQSQGTTSIHTCGDWYVTTTPAQHRFLNEALRQRFDTPFWDMILLPGEHEIQATVRVIRRERIVVQRGYGERIYQGIAELLALSVDGEEIFHGQESQSVRSLNRLELWTLIEAAFAMWTRDVAFWFDTPVCGDGDCGAISILNGQPPLPESYCGIRWEGFLYPPCWLPDVSYYSPPEVYARLNVLTNLMEEYNLFFNPWGMPDCCFVDYRLVDAESGEAVEPWYGPPGNEQYWGWHMLYPIPPSGRVAFEVIHFESCARSGEYLPEDCTFERIFEAKIEPAWALSFNYNAGYGIEMVPIYNRDWTKWIFPTIWATGGVPIEVLTQYLPPHQPPPVVIINN